MRSLLITAATGALVTQAALAQNDPEANIQIIRDYYAAYATG